MRQCWIRDRPIPTELLGELADSSHLLDDGAALRARLADDGYLFLKGALPLVDVQAARREVLERLQAVGEIAAPAQNGIATGTSLRAQREPDLGRFWRSVSEGPCLRALSHGTSLERIMGQVFGEVVRPQDYLFLRAAARGRATGLHYDYPFFGRLHDRVATVWIPIGPVPVEDGPLVIVEGSNRYRDLIEPMRGFDVATDSSRRADLGSDAITFAGQRGTRLLTRDFEPGDLVLFGMYTAHGSLDNHSAIGRVRLSCDVRWQPVSMPADERYFGDDPRGTTGAGYAELNGAKPLTHEWHVR